MRQEMLNHARDLLHEEGLDGFSMRKLAARVGVSATALYFHFKDKEEILGELVTEARHALREALEEPACQPDHLLRLRMMLATALEFAIRHHNHFRMFFKDVDTEPYSFFCHHLQEAMDAGTFHPSVSDPKLTGQMLWAGLHGVISLHATLGHDPRFDWRPMRQTAMRLFEMNLSGLVHGPLVGGLDDSIDFEVAGNDLDEDAKYGADICVDPRRRAGAHGKFVRDADA